MTPVQQFSCPICLLQYCQQNPARILTLCGHTFCHRCIRSLITKKKQNLYKIRCPIDNKIVQVDKPTPDLFPKNTDLWKVILKNSKQSKSNLNQFDNLNNLNNQELNQDNQFLNQEIKIKENIIRLDVRKQQSYGIKNQQIKQQNKCKQHQHKLQQKNQHKLQQKHQQKQSQQCLFHNKKLQLYCLQDNIYLCTDCVIFGQHRLHNVQTINKLLQKQQNFIIQIKKIIKTKKQLQLKLSNKQIQNQVIDLLDNKKNILLKQIHKQFNKIRQIVTQVQQNLIQQLQINTLNIAHRIKNKMRIQKYIDQQFKQWQNKSISIINNYQMKQLNRKQIVFVNLNDQKYTQLVQDGKLMIKAIQLQEKCLMENVLQSKIQTLYQQINKCFEIKQHTISIQPLCFKQIQSYHNNNNNIINNNIIKTQIKNYHHCKSFTQGNSKQNQLKQIIINQFEQQQSLLDFDRTNRLILQSKIQFNQNNQIKQDVNLNNVFIPNKQSKISIKSNNIMLSPKLNKTVSNNVFNKTVSFNSNGNVNGNGNGNMSHNERQKQPLRQKVIISNINYNNRKANNNNNNNKVKVSRQKPNSISSISSIQAPLNNRSRSTSSTRSLHKNKSSSLLSSSNIKQFNPKYFSILSQLSNNKQLQLLDLSYCQFHPSNVLKIIKQSQQSPGIKIIKLMRNNLDDGFIEEVLKIQRLFLYERVNFAQNKFTEDSLVKMLNIFKQNKHILRIQYINFSQNRIVQRKNNKIVQQYQKLGIKLVL